MVAAPSEGLLRISSQGLDVHFHTSLQLAEIEKHFQIAEITTALLA